MLELSRRLVDGLILVVGAEREAPPAELDDIGETFPCMALVVVGGPRPTHMPASAPWTWVRAGAAPPEIARALRRVLDQAADRLSGDPSAAAELPEFHFPGIAGHAPSTRALFDALRRIAPSEATVMIYGESGSGKELIARALHANSPRRHGPLVCVDCGALPDALLESELFGHDKGAFTDAHRSRVGRFEAADGGTLFLDEVGNMSPALQVRLLRVLQEGTFERLGDGRTISVDVRVIGATHEDLEARVAAGTFRRDLFYRLNVIPIHVPPLRERVEDIPLLVQHMVRNVCRRHGWPPKATSQALLRRMMRYDWPGNVRQLENTITRMVAMVPDRDYLHVTDLPPAIAREAQGEQPLPEVELPDEGLDFRTVVSEIERNLLVSSLRRTGGNKKRAAALLRMKRTTFLEKLKRLELEDSV